MSEEQIEKPTHNTYSELMMAGLFAPFILNKPIHFETNDWPRALIHLILSIIAGWIAMAWLFVDKYNFLNFLHGDWNSPARVYAFESNGEFMLYTIGILLILTWLFPALFQMLLNRTTLGRGQTQVKLSLITHSFTGTSFAFLFMPVMMIYIWYNSYSWGLELTPSAVSAVKICFFISILYGFICVMFQSKIQFGISLKKGVFHLWIPIILLILALWRGII
jgi:undecaprenyl pyrophosphate phosphatase UppP